MREKKSDRLLGYAVPLAAISAVASWIGHSLIGVPAPFVGTLRAPVVTGVALAVATFALQLAVAFGVGLVIDALAPSFGGKKVEPIAGDRLKAFLPETVDGLQRAELTTGQTSFGSRR